MVGMIGLLNRIIRQDKMHAESQLFSPYLRWSLVGLGIVSSVISLLVPALYYVRRKCREHPMALIAMISVLEALSNYNVILIAVNIYKFEEFLKIQRIFHFLVFFQKYEPSETDFCTINFTLYILLELLSIAYNICFSADLLITLKLPFFSGRKRMKFYHLFSILFVACLLPLSMLEAEKICEGEFHTRSIYRIPIAFIAALGGFFLVSLFITIVSFRSPQNSEIRSKYIRHHRIIMLVLVVVWAFPLATNILILLKDESSMLFKVFNMASFVSLLVSGGLVSIVRFSTDSYLWLQVKKAVCEWRFLEHSDREQEERKEELQGDVWNLPLANAVSTFHHQQVVSDIIQIVLETCTESNREVENSIFKRSDISSAQEDMRSHNNSSLREEGLQEEDLQEEDLQEPKLAKKPSHQKIQNLRFSSHYYNYGTVIIQNAELKELLKHGTQDELKKVTKIDKEIEMICLERRDTDKTEKNIFRTINLNDSGEPSLKNGRKNSLEKERKDSLKKEGKERKTSEIPRNSKHIVIRAKSLADPLFVALRIKDDLTSDQLKKTLDLSLNAENIVKARESLGASGSFFFFSYDNRLVIKTISEAEVEVFVRLLPYYYKHLIKYPKSLLSRAYGLFSVEIAGISKISFIMMENTFEAFENNRILYKKYDLKGSTIKREVKDSSADVLKDINYLRSNDAFLLMSADRKAKLMEQINADISLLSNYNIMDYSLLLGIGMRKSGVREHGSWRYFEDGSEITGRVYCLSLIDYLQEFNMNKYMELTLKKVFKGGGDISSIDTAAYFNRFLKFLNRIIVTLRT